MPREPRWGTDLESCQDASLFGIWGITPGTGHTAEAFCFGVESISYSNHSTHLTRGCRKKRRGFQNITSSHGRTCADKFIFTSGIAKAQELEQKIQKAEVPRDIQALTHSSLAVRVGVDLAIVLDDGQAGWDGGHHLIFTVLWAGAAGGLLTAAVITIEHPERVSPLSLWTWGAFSLFAIRDKGGRGDTFYLKAWDKLKQRMTACINGSSFTRTQANASEDLYIFDLLYHESSIRHEFAAKGQSTLSLWK